MAIVLAARLVAKDSASADKVQQHLKDIRDHALSDKEPGTLLYYPTRGNEDPLKFLIFEEYENQEAIKAHMSAEVFVKFASQADDLVEGGRAALDINYYTRF